MRHIQAAIQWLTEKEAREANVASHTTARLASLVLAIGSAGKADLDYTSFLPYEAESADGRPRLKPAVLNTIQSLIRERRLPMHVVAVLMEDIRHTLKRDGG